MLEILLIFTLLLLFLLVTSINLLISNNVNFYDNVLPEIFGFFLEGIFFVVIFTLITSYISKQQELKNKNDLKSTLKSFYGIFLFWSYEAGREGRININPNERLSYEQIFDESYIYKLIQYIDESNDIDPADTFIKDFAHRSLPEFQSLLSVAAQLGPKHLRCWRSIINHLMAITEANDNVNLKEHLILFLSFIDDFNKLPLS